MRQRPIICSALLVAMLLAGLGLTSVALSTVVGTLTDPAVTFAYWTRLPGGRALWVGTQATCTPEMTMLVCQIEGRTAHRRLKGIYFSPAFDRVEGSIRLPQR